MKKYTIDFHGKKITAEIGQLAKQANGSALVRYGKTVMLSAVTASKKPTDTDFFPLTVHFLEKLYAVGKIPGGYLRREGRPSEGAILNSRLIDRPLRPLFNENFRHEVNVIISALSVDNRVSTNVPALLASSIALCLSDIPFAEPVAAIVIGRINGHLLFNPSEKELEKSDFLINLAATESSIVMVEGEANEVPEGEIVEAILAGHAEIKKLVAWQKEIIVDNEHNKQGMKIYEISSSVRDYVNANHQDDIKSAAVKNDKKERNEALAAIEKTVHDYYSKLSLENEVERSSLQKDAQNYIHDLTKETVRNRIIKEQVRPDGRNPTTIRPLTSQVDFLPVVHGSALFERGETQVLSIVSLGSLSEKQITDDMSLVERKRFLHHYNFLPFSVGETGRVGASSRREIGHGALGERALLQVLPSEEDFPYTIRVVSEVLSSNGSTSQASICASSMALMAAGVPLSSSIAGIAMGLITDGEKHVILSDIQGLEDHFGDMDFKVAGTKKGICAIQMDIKIGGITKDILREALDQALVGRLEIINHMETVISESRSKLPKNVPKVEIIKIPVEKIRTVIGTGGKVINKIVADCDNVKIDTQDDGTIYVYHTNPAMIKKALETIRDLTEDFDIKIGEWYDGEVTRIEPFGAIVQLAKNVDGLLHISCLADHHVADVSEVIKEIGQKLRVKVIANQNGRLKLALTDKKRAPFGQRNQAEGFRKDDRGGGGYRRSFNRQDGGNRDGFGGRYRDQNRGDYHSGRNHSEKSFKDGEEGSERSRYYKRKNNQD